MGDDDVVDDYFAQVKSGIIDLIAANATRAMHLAMGKLEAHEYLNVLKAGELHESAAFAEQFAQYKAQYAFPEEG